jgi:ribosomal subunit interface protein
MIEIKARHDYVVTPELQKYIEKQMGKIIKWHSPKTQAEESRIEVVLWSARDADKRMSHCEAILHAYGTRFVATDSALNMFAAVDIVTVKIKRQAKDHRETHGIERLHRRIIRKIMRTPIAQ